LENVTHIDFTNPYTPALRAKVKAAMITTKQPVQEQGVYGCTQGPRLETAAEIKRMRRDGCDLVGMTGMPEAALARELELNYACCAIVVNWAAGLDGDEISMSEIEQFAEAGMVQFDKVLSALMK